MILKRDDVTRCFPPLDLTRLPRGADAYLPRWWGRDFASGQRLGYALLFIIDPANFVGHIFERFDRSLQRYLKKFSITRRAVLMQLLMQKSLRSIAIADALCVKHLKIARYSRCTGQFACTFLRRLGSHPDLVVIVLKRSIEQNIDISDSHGPTAAPDRYAQSLRIRLQSLIIAKSHQV
jgi:hypothetical protein